MSMMYLGFAYMYARKGRSMSQLSLAVKAEAIRLINQKMGDLQQATTGENLASIAYLSTGVRVCACFQPYHIRCINISADYSVELRRTIISWWSTSAWSRDWSFVNRAAWGTSESQHNAFWPSIAKNSSHVSLLWFWDLRFDNWHTNLGVGIIYPMQPWLEIQAVLPSILSFQSPLNTYPTLIIFQNHHYIAPGNDFSVWKAQNYVAQRLCLFSRIWESS